MDGGMEGTFQFDFTPNSESNSGPPTLTQTLTLNFTIEHKLETGTRFHIRQNAIANFDPKPEPSSDPNPFQGLTWGLRLGLGLKP